MKSRQFMSNMFVVTLIVVLALGLMLWVKFERRQTEASALALRESWVGNRFRRVQLVRGKVLLTPAPPFKNLSVPNSMELYVLSPPEKDCWRRPRVVNVGFKFGFFDGAKYYEYQIIGMKPDGVLLHFDYSRSPPRLLNEPREVLKMRWK